jgi:excisionase family DNA binding protein
MGTVPITFDQLPEAVGAILGKMEHLEGLLSAGSALVPAEKDDPIDVYDAAEFLKLHYKTVTRLANSGDIPHHKPAKQLLFFRSELRAWVQASRRKTNEEITQELDAKLSGSAA